MSKRLTKYLFLLLCFLPCILNARLIDSFYGTVDVQEPILLELIDSPPFQRLKHIHQYGVAYYTTHREEYSRYDHSMGVFVILRGKGASLEEQVAGLLHDVSHTVFSHVGDWIFGKEHKVKDYQNTIHAHYLEQSGLGKILRKYNLAIDQILPVEELYPALENSLPNLCADRIDYNLQGAYHQGFLTYEEVIAIFEDLVFEENRWISTQPDLMKKLARFSVFMTLDCWGSPVNYITSKWLAEAILRAIDLGCVSLDEVHFGTDQVMWDKLMCHEDPIIQKKMEQVRCPYRYFTFTNVPNETDLVVKSKFRGIDPWIISGSIPVLLTFLDEEIRKEFILAKRKTENGWSIRLVEN